MTGLPVFLKRPISDTPITSNITSPINSNDNSPLHSPGVSMVNIRDGTTSEDKKRDIDTSGEAEVDSGEAPLRNPPSYITQYTHPRKSVGTLDVPGLTKSKKSPDGTISNDDLASKLIIIMVGLPATGKSFMANKLSRYLNYSMYDCKAFNVGNTRRLFSKENGLKEQDSNFFDSNNSENNKLRDLWALDTLNLLLDYLIIYNGSVGIFDATNTTKERRKLVVEKIRERSKCIEVVFLETISSSPEIQEENIRLKLFGPDYKGKNKGEALKDFKERLKNYNKAYEPLEDKEKLPYIKMIDVGEKIITYKIKGFLASQTIYYLMNFTLNERQIWITRNGESEFNVKGCIGGDSNLTSRGIKYSKALSKFINKQRINFNNYQLEKINENKKQYIKTDDSENNSILGHNSDNESEYDKEFNEFFVWSSMRKRCVQTVQYFDELDYPIKQMKMLDELNAGDYEGKTYQDIQENFPEEFEERHKDKLRYRYPGIGGESYMDVINRLRPVINEIERLKDNVLIVTHRVAARVLLGYFMNLGKNIIANLDIPLHCIYCLDLKPYGISWSLWEYNESFDDFIKLPESILNTTKVKEVGLVYKERVYSSVPTAPLSTCSSSSEAGISHKNISNTSSANLMNLNIDDNYENLMVVPTISTKNLLENGGGGTSISTAPQRQPTANTTSSHYHQTQSQYQIKPSILTNVTDGDDNLDIKTKYSLSPRHF